MGIVNLEVQWLLAELGEGPFIEGKEGPPKSQSWERDIYLPEVYRGTSLP